MSTWTFDEERPLLGCGIDAEQVGRFEDGDGQLIEPWSLIFTEREIEHARSSYDPAAVLCACFCCKEALLKALGTSIDYRDCELLFSIGRLEQDLLLSEALRVEHGIGSCRTRVEIEDKTDDQECVASVCLFGLKA